MQIKKILKMKNNKYKIFIDDDCITTFDNVIIENNLLYKKTIDKELYKKIQLDTLYYDVYNKTVNYILKRRRSEKEIRTFLKKFDIGISNANKIISKLKDIKLIDDFEYAKAYINDKLYLGKEGINKIKNDLLYQDISSDAIDKLLLSLDNDILDEKLEKMILKKIRLNNKYSNSYLKQKILNEMINLGYEKNKIISVIDKNLKDDSSILISEFNKLYYSLSKKYKSFELENKIKQKLMSKGFKIDDINSLIKEKTEK